MKVPDFGCGPIPVYQCSATPYVSEIVFAEYSERNRKALQMWLDKDPNAFDFTPFFNFNIYLIVFGEYIERNPELRRKRRSNIKETR